MRNKSTNMVRAAAPRVDDDGDSDSRSYDSRQSPDEGGGSRSYLSEDDGASFESDGNPTQHHDTRRDDSAPDISGNEDDDASEVSYRSGGDSASSGHDRPRSSSCSDEEPPQFNENCSVSQSSGSQGEGSSQRSEEGSLPSQQDDRCCDDEKSYVDDEDERSFISGEIDDDPSCASGELDDRSFVSGRQDNDRSFVSGERDDSRSKLSDDPDDKSFDDSQPDDRSFASNAHSDDQSFRSGDQDDDRSIDSGEDDRLTKSRKEDDRSFSSGKDDRSGSSGDCDRSDNSADEDHIPRDEDGDSSIDGSDSRPNDGPIHSRRGNAALGHIRHHQSVLSDDDESQSADDVDNSREDLQKSMSFSELAESSHGEDVSTTRQGQESGDLATQLPRVSSSPKFVPVETEENSMWLSQLEKSSDMPQQRSSSTVSGPDKSVSGNDDVQSVPAIEEKSLWLSSLEQPSDDSYSEGDSNAREEQDESYDSSKDGDPREDDSYSNSQENDVAEDELEDSQLDDSFVSGEEDGSRDDRDMESSFVPHDCETSQSNSRGDGDDTPVDDLSVSSGPNALSPRDEASESHQGDSISRSQHLEDSLASRDYDDSDSDPLDDSFVSKGGYGSKTKTKSNIQHGHEIIPPSGRVDDSGSSSSKSQRVDSFVTRDDERSCHSNTQHDEESHSYSLDGETDSAGGGSYKHENESHLRDDGVADDSGSNSHRSTMTDGFASFANDTDHGKIYVPSADPDASSENSLNISSEAFGKSNDDSESDDAVSRSGKDESHRPTACTTTQVSVIESDSEPCGNDSTLSGFDSFANDNSLTSRRRFQDGNVDASLHSVSRVDDDDLEEDTSVLSLLPADTFAQKSSATINGRPMNDDPDANSFHSQDTDTDEYEDDVLEGNGRGVVAAHAEAGASVRTFSDYSTNDDKRNAAANKGTNVLQSSNGTIGEFSDSSSKSFDDAVAVNDFSGNNFGVVSRGDFFENSELSNGSKVSVGSELSRGSERPRDISKIADESFNNQLVHSDSDRESAARDGSQASFGSDHSGSGDFSPDGDAASQCSGSRTELTDVGSLKERQPALDDTNTVVSTRSAGSMQSCSSSQQSEGSGTESELSRSSASGSGSFAGDHSRSSKPENDQISPRSEQLVGNRLESEATGGHSMIRSENASVDGSRSASGSVEGSFSVSGSECSSGSYSDGSSSSNLSLLSELQSMINPTETSLRLPKPNSFGGYTREQMFRLVTKARASESASDKPVKDYPSSPRKMKRRDTRERAKSETLLELVLDVNDAMTQLEKELGVKTLEASDDEAGDVLLTSSRLLYAFEALVGIFLQLSDELELLVTFSKGKVSPAIQALDSLLAFSKTIDDTFMILKPILHHYLTAEIDEELDDFLYGMNLLVDLLCELSHRVGEKQQWNARANTAFVSMLELLARDTLEVSCIYEDVDTPGYELTDLIQDAWEATGHVEEVKTLQVTSDLFMFRQICYEVLLSTDQWCPDNNTLIDICGIDDESDDGQVQPNEGDVLSPPPDAALQILEKIHGDPLPRTVTLASVLRRILPAQAITDPTISETFARIRNTIRNPLGMPPSSLVTITSIPESLDDPDSLGVAGVGKTTLAAMVANHDDVQRFFSDGIAWIYVGETELNYNRYVQCLQDLLSQLEVDEEEEPLFPELLHIPGESYAMRRRREEGFMIYLRETMVEFLRFRNVLVILDDVCFEPDLDWFDFAPAPLADEEEEEDEGSCAILITSRRRNLLPPADTVEVDMLDEDEGVELLIKESGELSRALIADAPETKSVVLECACHPLTVKSVGRWLSLKHATAVAGNNVEEIQGDVVSSMDKILKSGLQDDCDMMYEILNMSLSPAVNGEPTSIIKFCFAAFVRVFCDRKHISDFALADSTPIVPMGTTELLFESLLNLEEESLLQEGSLFYAQKKEAATLIPEALSALGVFKVIITYAEAPEGSPEQEEEDEKYLQIMHRIQQEYGEYLYEEDETLTELTKDGERRWNKAFAQAFLARGVEWDTQAPDAGLDYALEMLPSHMLRGGLLLEAGQLLRNSKFVRGRLFALGREHGSRRHIKDCETLFDQMVERRAAGQKKVDPKGIIRSAYDTLGSLLKMDEDEYIEEEGSPEAVEVGRCHFEIGVSLAGRRCWEGAISHWERSQEFLVSSLGMVELVAGILYNVGVVNAEMLEYEHALVSLKQCLRIRGAIHGEEHILYAQTIQKIGDVFLAMSDYHEAMESYNWALDVMHIEPSHHRIDIGDILEQMGKIHYSKGEIEESLQSFQDALRSKQVDLGEDHPELATIFHQIGNCLSNQGRTDEAIAHLEEAIRLKKLDPDGGYERDADVLTIEGILNNLNNMQKEGLECYEKSLQILVTKVPHKKEKVASLLHLIGCVYLMSGAHKKAMKLFEESLHARRKVLGFVHLDVASTLFNMAFLHQSRNRLDKALKCLEEALKIRQLRLPDSEKVAVTHEKIGNLARGIGKTKKAENAFTEALRIRKIIHGQSHEAVATVLQEIGDLMDDLGEYEDAMKHYVEALEIRENRLGPDDLAVAETYYSMGFTLQNNGALDRALQCLEESLSIRKFQFGDDAKDVGDTLNMMGFLQAKRGELDDALSLLWDALRIRKLHEDHVKVSETLNNIGNVHREKQEYDLAIECYEECLRIRRAELGDEHEKVADALIAMGNVQSDLDYTEEAMDSYKEGTTTKYSCDCQSRLLAVSSNFYCIRQRWRSET